MGPGGGAPRFAIAGLVVIAVALGALRTRDVAAADRMAAACLTLRAERARWWTANEGAFRPYLAGDLGFFHEAFDELGEAACTEVEPRLRASWGTAVFATWSGAPWPPDRLAALRAAIERTRARCIVVQAALRATGPPALGDGLSTEETCDELMVGLEGYASLDRESASPEALLDWPAHIETLARTLASPE